MNEIDKFFLGIDTTYQRQGDWTRTYEIMQEKFGKSLFENPYSSPIKNFDNFFCYRMIEKKVNIEDFRDVFLLIQKRKMGNMVDFYNIFFHQQNEKRLKEDSQSSHLYTSIHFTFLDIQENGIYLKNKEYYYILIESTKDVKSFNWANGITIINRLSLPEDFLGIYKASQKNPWLESSKEHEYEKFTDNLLTIIANKPNAKEIIDLIKTEISNFDNIFSKLMINHKASTSTHNFYYLHIENSFLKLAQKCNLDVLKMLQIQYQADYPNKLKDSQGNLEEASMWGNAKTISMVMRKSELELQSNILPDTSKNLNESFIYFAFLEHQLYKGRLELTPELMDYVSIEIDKFKDNKLAQEVLDFKIFNSYLQHFRLQETLPDNDKNHKKMKI